MSKKSLLTEMRDTQLAIELIELGARPQVLESETTLSRERLLKLYKEVKGVSPPKGMLPFSTDWFLTWLPNVHSSLFINIHRHITKNSDCSGIELQPVEHGEREREREGHLRRRAAGVPGSAARPESPAPSRNRGTSAGRSPASWC